MSKFKLWLFGLAKPLILSHVKDLGAFAPRLAAVIVSKTNLTQTQADNLSAALIDVVESELVILINKI